ncbi:hypothetical protein MMC32_002048 [Xylographa parallela]|nr:hypothetical protein [Xylographa parallela]
MAPIKKPTPQKRFRVGRRHSLVATLLAINYKKLNKRLDKIIQLLEVRVSATARKNEGENVTKATVPTTSPTFTIDWDVIKAIKTSILPSSQTATPEANAQPQSRLMLLPRELRNQIYELVLVSSGPIIEPHRQMSQNRDDATTCIEDINSSLLMTCRRVYAEAEPLLYGTLNTFQFGSPRHVRLFTTGARCRPADSIRHVSFVFPKPYPQDFKGRAVEAKVWVTSLFPMFEMKDVLLPGLEVLELDLTSWEMRAADEFPPSLVTGLQERGWKVQKLVLRGLEEQPVLEEFLEQTLLQFPPARVLTNADGQVLEVAGSSSAG